MLLLLLKKQEEEEKAHTLERKQIEKDLVRRKPVKLIKLLTGISCGSSVDDNHTNDHIIKSQRQSIGKCKRKDTSRIKIARKISDEKEKKNFQTNSPKLCWSLLAVYDQPTRRRPIIIFNIFCTTKQIKQNINHQFSIIISKHEQHNNCFKRI